MTSGRPLHTSAVGSCCFIRWVAPADQSAWCGRPERLAQPCDLASGACCGRPRVDRALDGAPPCSWFRCWAPRALVASVARPVMQPALHRSGAGPISWITAGLAGRGELESEEEVHDEGREGESEGALGQGRPGRWRPRERSGRPGSRVGCNAPRQAGDADGRVLPSCCFLPSSW